VTVLETKCPSFGESNSDDALLKHLPQVIAQSRVGYKRIGLSYDSEGTVPFILTDSNTWFFGALAPDSADSDKWTCFRSHPVRLSLNDAGSDPDTPAGIKFDEEVRFLLRALLCWTPFSYDIGCSRRSVNLSSLQRLKRQVRLRCHRSQLNY